MLRVVFDPAATSYADLLAYYRDTHTPRRSFGQYRSILFPMDDGQLAEARRYLGLLGGGVEPEVVAPGTPEARFWDAEDYHQKYRLRRNQALVPLLASELGPRWDEHTIATRLNAAGEGQLNVAPWLQPLSPEAQRAFHKR